MASLPRFSQSPTDPGFVQDPYPAYERMRALGPIVQWEEYGIACLTGFEAVNTILRDRRFGREILHVTTRAALGWAEIPDHLRPFYEVEAHSLLEREPPVHTRLRTLISRAFVSRAIERLRPRATALAHDLIDRFVDRGTVDLLPAFATPIPVVMIAELLGVPVERADDLLDWSHRMVAMYQFNRSRAVEDAAVAATQAFVAFMRDHVEARRRAPADDLISHLIAAEEAGDRLSTDELITTCILLLNAGHEATVHGIGNGVRVLLRAGIDPAEAFRDATATERCVDEMLRFDPPLHLFTRYALEPITVAGHHFKVGDQIGLLLAAANRDPKRFGRADRFLPDRDEGSHLAFGAGIHFCIGQPLARLEMQCALPALFQRLPGLRLASEPRFADRYHFHGLERLDVTL